MFFHRNELIIDITSEAGHEEGNRTYRDTNAIITLESSDGTGCSQAAHGATASISSCVPRQTKKPHSHDHKCSREGNDEGE